MVAAMLGIPVVDGFAKYLSADYSPLFIAWARYAVASGIVLPLAVLRFGRHIFPTENLKAHILRTTFLVGAMTLYFIAISTIPLAMAVGAFFVGPIVAVVLSVLLLGERMTTRKGISLGLGVLGAAVILRPGGTVEPGVILAFAAGCLFAFYLVSTRTASQNTDPVKTLAFQCVLGSLLLAPQAVVTAQVPAADTLILFAGLGLFSALCHLMSIAAFRWADASTLAPLVYLELVGAAAIGIFVFAEVPTLPTLAGVALIAAGGLVLMVKVPRA